VCVCVAVRRIVVRGRRLGVGWWLGGVCVVLGWWVRSPSRLLLLSRKAMHALLPQAESLFFYFYLFQAQ